MAHKLARLVYRMLQYGTAYVAESLAEYEAQMRATLERSVRRKAESLGFDLVPKPATPPSPPRTTRPVPIPTPASRARGKGASRVDDASCINKNT